MEPASRPRRVLWGSEVRRAQSRGEWPGARVTWREGLAVEEGVSLEGAKAALSGLVTGRRRVAEEEGVGRMDLEGRGGGPMEVNVGVSRSDAEGGGAVREGLEDVIFEGAIVPSDLGLETDSSSITAGGFTLRLAIAGCENRRKSMAGGCLKAIYPAAIKTAAMLMAPILRRGLSRVFGGLR